MNRLTPVGHLEALKYLCVTKVLRLTQQLHDAWVYIPPPSDSILENLSRRFPGKTLTHLLRQTVVRGQHAVKLLDQNFPGRASVQIVPRVHALQLVLKHCHYYLDHGTRFRN